MNIEYSLLENGFDFVVSSINNLKLAREESNDETIKKRLIKYAILHLSSGIELVFKHRLLKENWTYIFADMNKAKRHDLESGDFKSVDSVSNIERLKNLCDISLTKDEEKALETLRKRRNKIEHFKIKESVEAVEVIMCDSLSLILNFIAKHIDLKTISDEENELFETIKRETVVLEEVVAAREKMIETSAKNDGVFDQLITCPACLKRFLLSEDTDNNCLLCYYSDTPEKVADAYISNVLGVSAYSCMKDGEEYPLYECPECSEDALVLEYEKDNCFCFNCGFSSKLCHIYFCSECGQLMYSKDEDERISVCSSCLDYKISKDD